MRGRRWRGGDGGGLTTATLLTLLVVPASFDDAELVTGRAIRHALGTTPAERAQA